MVSKVRKTTRKIATEEKRMMIFDLIKYGFSYSRVGELMGMSKNAVSGFVFRDKHKHPLKEKIVSPHAHTVKKVKNIINLDMPQTPLGLTIFELKSDSCRYMIGHHKYCGAKEFEQSYCQHHFIQCHDLSRSKKWKTLIR